MSTLMITYDLHQPGQKYGALHEAIKSLGAWWHFLESTWLVVTPNTPATVWNLLATHVDQNDGMLIMNVSKDAYSGWLPQDAWTWINNNV